MILPLLLLAAAPLDTQALAAELVAKHGAAQKPRITRGLAQVAALWRKDDGDLGAFAREHFVADPQQLDALFDRFEANLEQVDGHLLEINRELKRPTDLDLGPTLGVDPLFAAWDPTAHLVDDFFETKLAFVALLNFPLTSLDEKLGQGPSWTRRQWAEARLTGRFGRRVPAAVQQDITSAQAAADLYIAEYNVWMHHVLSQKGERLFPKGMRLISHWNLRDELKAAYADPAGPAKQRTIVKIMERIVTQTIPAAVIDNPRVDWNPFTNAVTATPKDELEDKAPERAGHAGRQARARRPLRDAAGQLGLAAQGRPLLAHRSHGHRSRLRPRRRDAGGPHQGPAGRGAQEPAGAEGGSRDRAAGGPQAGAHGPLVQRLPPARRHPRRAARREAAREVPHRRRLRQGHAAAARGPGLHARAGQVPVGAHSRRPFARRRARPAVGPPRRLPPPAHPGGEGRHELQGLQHRRPRDGAQRRAGLLALRRRSHLALGRAQHGLHRGHRLRLPGQGPGAAGRGQARRGAGAAARAQRLLVHLGDRRRGARRHRRLALDVRPPRRHARPAARGHRRHRQADLEHVLRPGAGRARRGRSSASTRT